MNMKKIKKEIYEKEIKNLEKMVPLDYFSILNSEKKINCLMLKQKIN